MLDQEPPSAIEETQADAFDAQIEADIQSGKLDAHFDKAIADISASIEIPCKPESDDDTR